MAGDELGGFINEILTKKQLPGMTDEIRVQLISDLKERLINQINRAIIDALPDDKIDEFNNFLELQPRTDEEVQEFISHCGVDLKATTIQAMLLFRELYLQTPKQREE